MTKLIKNLLIVFVVLLGITACDKLGLDKKGNPAEIEKNEYTSENEASTRSNGHDSTYQDFAVYKEEITASIESLKAELHAQTNQVKDNEKTIARWRVITIAAIVLAIIALMLTLHYKHKIKQLEKKLNEKFNNKLEELYNKVSRESSQRENSKKQVPSMEGHYLNLEKKISELENAIKSTPSPKRSDVEPSQTSSIKVGYAKINYQDIFTEVLPSMKEGCVYKIKFINDNEGEFELIELSMLQQMPNYKDVVEIVDGCPLSEATKYEVVSPGKCMKIKSANNVYAWKVTEKLKIKTLK